MKKAAQAVYNLSIAVLYNFLKFAWNLYLNYWEEFSALSDVYTEEYGQTQLKAIEAAQALPDNEQRQGSQQSVGNKLTKATKKGVMMWKQLKSFIIKSYTDPGDQQAALKQAGIAHYDKAAAPNYSEASLLLSDGLSFINANIDELTKGGMPARFVSAYTEAKTAFDAQQALYGTAKGTSKDGTVDKVAANNTIYITTKYMLADGVNIFVDKPEIAAQFTKAAILRLITTDGISGIHFVVRDLETKMPLDTATINIVGVKGTFSVNKRGVYDIRLPKATYYFTVTVPDYPVYQGSVVLDANVMRRAEVLVKKADSATAVS